ncbi:type II toxin-antitoxin system HipA family toxin [Leifsonia sp. NCR5]|uniref:type II toxin-antitoxin system HipA family toxin n=1 Tax=Leifsonia sp. NCR5 TaxID=1978342 RepID=UPI000A18DB14|nr:HipA domain-containing protein [Leifsonia sp. NCR5]
MAAEPMRLLDVVDVHSDEGPGKPVLVGTLRASYLGGRTLVGSSFEYAQSYLSSPRRYAISPDLPLVSGKQFSGEDATLFGAFADVTPDDWGAGLIDTEYARLREDGSPRSIGEFDHLVQQNDATRMGSLRFTAQGASRDDGAWLTAGMHTGLNAQDVHRIAEAASRFEEYEATDEDIEILGFAGSSLGGARPKATIEESDGSLWMLKLPSNRDRHSDLEAWEATALDIAEQAGLRVPRRRLIRLAEHESSLLIERFDRAGEHRVGFISAMTAMELTPQNQGATYADFADTIDRLVSVSAAADLREMFRRVALTVLVGNVDDHWKNHGFVRERGTWRLSPLFDVNPNRAGSRVRSRRISDRDDPTNRDIRLLIETREVYGLTAVAAAEALAGVVSAVGAWGATAAGNGISAAEIERMASAFDETQREYAAEFMAKHL